MAIGTRLNSGPCLAAHGARRTAHWLLGISLLSSACGPSQLTIHASLNDRPLRGLEITAYPFDPAPLVDSLERASGEPRPSFPELDLELRGYRPPETADMPAAPAAQVALHDSVVRLADSLRGRDRRDRAYRAAYDRLRTLYLRLGRASADRQRLLERFMAGDRALAQRATHAADSMRAWEQRALAGLEEVARNRAEEIGRPPLTLLTDSMGVAIDLPEGAWWLMASTRHPENPFLEYRWGVGVVVGALSDRLPLTEISARLVWRH